MEARSSFAAQVQPLLDQLRAGDFSVSAGLLPGIGDRLLRSCRRACPRFPSLCRWADPEDVLQGAAVRLLRALHAVHPVSSEEFFGLAALQVRRELLDLVRHYCGSRGPATHESGQLLEAAWRRLACVRPN